MGLDKNFARGARRHADLHFRSSTIPPGFHIGFVQESEERVNEVNRRLREDGYGVPQPERLHGYWTFYFKTPGGFTIEVLA